MILNKILRGQCNRRGMGFLFFFFFLEHLITMEGKGGPITGLVNMKCEDLLKVGCPEVTLLVKTRVRKVYNYVIKNE